MSLRNKLIAMLPPINNKKVVIKQKQGTTDIINTIAETHEDYAPDYDLIANCFDTGNIYTTAQNIWNFEKYQLVYNAEPGKDQTVKSPARILSGPTVDCKHYALFAGGVLDAILREHPEDGFKWWYRFAGEPGSTDVGHVFVVAQDTKGREIWVDPCLTAFDQRKKYSIIEDYQPMLSKVSGINTPPTAIVTVDKQQAWQSFLGLLNMDFLQFKELMLKNMAVTTGPVQQYCIDNGLDYNQLLNFLNA